MVTFGGQSTKMGIEIERKFLLRSDAWTACAAAPVRIRQGYVVTGPPVSVRVRMMDDSAELTIKSDRREGGRTEFNVPLAYSTAREMLDELGRGDLIEKVRYKIPLGNLVWEVDVFEGRNAGLVVAEVELDAPDQVIDLPEWIGDEVTEDLRYLNANLSRHPYTEW